MTQQQPCHDQSRATGLLRRLLRDVRGNTMIISATAIIPLLGLVGSGIDIGRVYATQTRLQQACDSAVLVGRKEMVGNNFSTSVEDSAETFFRNNFADTKFGSRDSKIDFVVKSTGALTATATAKVPMSLMKIFGRTQTDISVVCQAEMNMSNTDIMFVLDTTGSMASTNPGDPYDRMTVMRTSVKAFHNQVETAKNGNTQIRYGFMPYSKTVNVGHLLAPNWLRDSWTYQSREPGKVETFNDAGGDVITQWTWEDVVNDPWPVDTITNLPLEQCVQPSSTITYTDAQQWQTSAAWAGPPAGTQTKTRYKRTYSGINYWLEQSATVCRLHAQDYNGWKIEFTDVATPAYSTGSSGTRYWWDYDQITVNTSALTVGGSVSVQTGANHTYENHVWNGCIEERLTIKRDTYDPIPIAALDLQIDLVPNALSVTQWGPWIPSLIWARPDVNNWEKQKFKAYWDTQNYATYNGGMYGSCPSPARKLSSITASDLDSYLASLVPTGATHHDIGMVWGARLLSPTGLFASENASAPNGGSITRHLIFMTDGETDTTVIDYDAYGVNVVDRRRLLDPNVKPNKAESDLEVQKRFAGLCAEVKRRNITVWVIAFGINMTDMLSECASPGKAFQAANATQLNDAFSAIASSISRLRLTD